jgi:hypothetical protein
MKKVSSPLLICATICTVFVLALSLGAATVSVTDGHSNITSGPPPGNDGIVGVVSGPPPGNDGIVLAVVSGPPPGNDGIVGVVSGPPPGNDGIIS